MFLSSDAPYIPLFTIGLDESDGFELVRHLRKLMQDMTTQKIGHKMLGLCQIFSTTEPVAICEELENSRDFSQLQQILSQLYLQIDNAEV